MPDIRNSILATIVYYDGFEHPLTVYEIWRFLIHPQRLSRALAPSADFSLDQIANGLEGLIKRGDIVQKLGFYFLASAKDLAEKRLVREKIAAQKWKTFLRRAWWLQWCPWVEGFFASGSLALGNTTPQSDFDVLIIMRPGRLYLGRFLISGLTSLLGIRRTKDESVAPNKLCFNHYITTNALTIKHESLYNAQTYAHLVPSYISNDLRDKFFTSNIWIHKYFAHWKPHQNVTRRTVKQNPTARAIAHGIEVLLDNSFGDYLERRARAFQQKRIKANPATGATGGRIIYTDTELEFHPRSFERVVLDHYNEKIKQLGIMGVHEPDSGLN